MIPQRYITVREYDNRNSDDMARWQEAQAQAVVSLQTQLRVLQAAVLPEIGTNEEG